MNFLEKIGIEKPLMQWTEPPVVTRLNWQFKEWPECKRLFPLFAKIGILVGVPILIPTKIWLPEGFVPGLLATTFFCLLFPSAVIAQMWINSKTQWICCIRKSGIGKSYSPLSNWESIIAHQFIDHPDLSNVRVLSLKVHDESGEHERQFCFDPNETSEPKIRELVEPHLK